MMASMATMLINSSASGLMIQKDVIKFRDGVFTVKSWDESKKPIYIAKTQNKNLGSWTFKIEKVKDGVVYQGAVFKKD